MVLEALTSLQAMETESSSRAGYHAAFAYIYTVNTAGGIFF